MHAFIQGIVSWYFGILEQFGLLGVVILMAMESSIFPVPSEMVVPPAAVVYASDPHRDGAVVLIIMVILAGTFGSLLGASATYWVARWLGRPLVVKYGKYVLISEKKLREADEWMIHYGAAGIFFARLLPVVRHVISIPAGIVGMRFRTFAIMTTVGSFIWCTVLAIFGVCMREDMLVMIQGVASPEEKMAFNQAFHNLTFATLTLVGVVSLAYWLMVRQQKKLTAAALLREATPETSRE